MYPVIIVGAESPEIVKETIMVPAATMIEALGFAVQHVRRTDLYVLIILHAPLTSPYM